MAQKLRLDIYLVTKGHASSRHKAQQLIRAGRVRDATGTLLDKPGQEVLHDLQVQIKETPRFVSRGGEKLLEALSHFPVVIKDKICIDGGISTGGFTDCLLQHGARKIYGIDVGYGQADWNLRNDSRVVLRERTNLRSLTPQDLYGPLDEIADFAVADLSFISLRLVLPSIRQLLLSKNSEAIVLVKPQFEVGRERVRKGGVVKDPQAHIDALKSVIANASIYNWFPKGLLASPITGPAGNHEYLLWLGKENAFDIAEVQNVVYKTLSYRAP